MFIVYASPRTLFPFCCLARSKRAKPVVRLERHCRCRVSATLPQEFPFGAYPIPASPKFIQNGTWVESSCSRRHVHVVDVLLKAYRAVLSPSSYFLSRKYHCPGKMGLTTMFCWFTTTGTSGNVTHDVDSAMFELT